jgi:hypothetical protein
VIFVDHPAYFDRAGIYVEGGADYPDNPRRFALFTRAALEVIPMIVKGPLLLHAHDWHSSLALVYMRSYADLHRRFQGTGAVLSVHNAGYQGYFSPAVIGDLGHSSGDLQPPSAGVVRKGQLSEGWPRVLRLRRHGESESCRRAQNTGGWVWPA